MLSIKVRLILFLRPSNNARKILDALFEIGYTANYKGNLGEKPTIGESAIII